ncbi:hypothetical protein JT739_06685 [Tepidanaerobacter sp. GT38]|uniref:hypothetical protein n=1 Tax=Tepidanaerobacter sp. GT38 TaxID=2722793 RepID=UPI001F254366|nr:hypothetical protein [Tepidanaerobacter sp. GT38]MCG1012283.1 hypothetical protein [Tepidanaerobacter sp. GT38]
MRGVNRHTIWFKRFLAVLLTACTGLAPVMYMSEYPAVAATVSSSLSEPLSTDANKAASSLTIAPSCDETFYALLDCYGNIVEGSVVKSYLTYGNTKIIDYGDYDEVINLTDDKEPEISGDKVTFDLSIEKPERFYFEGKTDKPFRDLPWTISISYRLNGVPTMAEQLPGKAGLVEINLDVIPKRDASEYNRNNLVLAATAIFNADDILSLEADGAQVQLMGNLRSVLYMILPGEEQHFTIRVGTDNFSFGGMLFTAFPATLVQLDQIADLRNARVQVEDSYHAICDSLDVILDTLDGMSGSLSTAANGLDQLNLVRKTISSGKDNLYSRADKALDSMNILTDTIVPAASHLHTASSALTDVTNCLTDLTQNAIALKPELEDIRHVILRLQDDMANIRSLTADVESYYKSAARTTYLLKNDLDDLSDDLDDLESSLSQLKKTLDGVSGISKVDTINVGGMTSAEEVKRAVSQARQAYSKYEQFLAANGITEADLSFENFLSQYGGKSADEVEGIIALLDAADDPDFEEQLKLMETANAIIPTVNKTIREINSLISSITGPTKDVVSDLENLCSSLGDSGISGDLERMSILASDLLSDLNEHKGELAKLTRHLDDLGDLAIRVSNNADTALALIQELNDNVNSYVPDAQQALSDAINLSNALAENLRDVNSFLSSAESLLRSSGSDLDEGSRKLLASLAEVFRKSATGLNETSTIRRAKDTITNLIEDEWEKYTGGENNLLLMDADAKPVSLTSPKNDTPASIQYIMRTQEIKEENSKGESTTNEETDNGTFWMRVKDMFRGIWNIIASVFSHKK